MTAATGSVWERLLPAGCGVRTADALALLYAARFRQPARTDRTRRRQICWLPISNSTKRTSRIIFAVSAAYYQLIGAQGEIAAAEATLRNSQTVQESAEERSEEWAGNAAGCAGSEGGDGTGGLRPGNVRAAGTNSAREPCGSAWAYRRHCRSKCKGLDSNAAARRAKRTGGECDDHAALRQRPDLLAQMAASTRDRRRHQASAFAIITRAFLFGNGGLSISSGARNWAAIRPVTTQGETWLAQLSARWTIFDARARYNELDRATLGQSGSEGGAASRCETERKWKFGRHTRMCRRRSGRSKRRRCCLPLPSNRIRRRSRHIAMG